MAKKKKSWLDLVNEAEVKTQQDAAQGKINFREASKASQIQYTQPTYTGNSKTANYKWETCPERCKNA